MATCARQTLIVEFSTNVEDDFNGIGGRLKAARIAAGLTVDDVVFQTQLPRSVVEALEAEVFTNFASPLYAKSFLAQYSGFLNVEAQPWLDAIEPVDFAPDELLPPVVAAVEVPPPQAPDSGTRGGWWALLGLLALSCALLAAALKGYDFFEARFGGEKTAAPVPESPPPVIRSKPGKKSPLVKEEEELAKPPPRAIIVR